MRGVISTAVRLSCAALGAVAALLVATSRTPAMLYRAHHVSVSMAGGQCSATAMTELWQPAKWRVFLGGGGGASRNCESADTQVVGNGMQQGTRSASAHFSATSTTATAAGWAPPPVSVQAPGQGGEGGGGRAGSCCWTAQHLPHLCEPSSAGALSPWWFGPPVELVASR
jgi:hypothetical protein